MVIGLERSSRFPARRRGSSRIAAEIAVILAIGIACGFVAAAAWSVSTPATMEALARATTT
jgi:hypothetical protein